MTNEKGYVPIWSGHPDPFPVSLSVSLFNDSYKATLGNISQEFLEGKVEVSVIPLIFQEKLGVGLKTHVLKPPCTKPRKVNEPTGKRPDKACMSCSPEDE
ncbi:hypothetical protein CWI38_0975p0010 [Hamiltosporidium tvaerminnensis]|uniref:Uncharacterized protein n=1 Tax=Hamiltosporidium tvaerminnensis TaxID=1176355 RepID=A0A4Q9LTI2_9MICR|nr:hypothetical protein CWI38_0975p0010 [Hamiltosporidium tvaerminnensis]